MRIKPTHLRACIEVAREDHESEEAAVKAIIAKYNELTAEDITYAAVRQYVSKVDGTAMYMAYGGFPTKAAALKAAENGTVGYPGMGVLAIVPVRSHTAHLAKVKSLGELPEHLANLTWTKVRERVG